MAFTPQQEDAINLRGKNILVAAAAGSGKTTILVERIKKLIIEDGIGIDEMLVVTFTNAAASEMREKIIKAINEELEKNDSDFLRKQIDLIPTANISTFHAFGIQVIRENFHKIGLEPGFKICNEAQSEIFKQEAIEELLDSKYDAEDEGFLDFVDAFGSERHDRGIIDLILEGHNALMSLPHPWEEAQEKLAEIEDIKKDSSYFASLASLCRKEMARALALSDRACEIARNADIVKIYETLLSENEMIRASLEMMKDATYDQIKVALDSINFGKLAAKKDEKENYELVKDQIKALRDSYKKKIDEKITKRFFYAPFEELAEEIRATYPRTKVLIDLIKEFDEIYKAKKAEENLLDFSDIEHYALEVLGDEQIQGVYRNKFKQIFIDEYQDSNLVQEAIIERIARENNRFLVGDVKQSIYKFRLAEPEIFHDKYRKYASDEDENSIKIDLNKNFRSKGHVIDSVNLFFESLMEGYDADSALYKGDEYEGELDKRSELHIVSDSIEETADMDDKIVLIERAEKEAMIAVNIIKEALTQNIYDSKTKEIRKVQKKDIVILMRSVKSYADSFTKVLMDAGIPSFINDSEGYFDTIEIENMVNLLKVIDNRKQDIPLISVLYSPIFRFTLEDLIDIRNSHKKGAFYEAWLSYAKLGENEALKEKCQDAISKLNCYKKLSISLPLDEFVWKIMLDSGLYLAMGALVGGVQRQANLRALVDKATEYQENLVCSLFSFIQYIEQVQAKGVSVGQVKLVGENDDLVRIMTIHKSKGLEFPVVIVAGLGKKLNVNGKSLNFHKNYGITLPMVDTKAHWKKNTLLQNIVKAQNDIERLEEDIRVFYVALTRAKDRLAMIGTVRDVKELDKKLLMDVSGESTYLDMILNIAVKSDQIDIKTYDANSIKTAIYQKKRKLKAVLDLFDNEEPIDNEKLRAEVDSRLSFVYPHENALKLKQKYSVSELNKLGRVSGAGGIDEGREQEYYRAPRVHTREEGLSAAQRGTAYHLVMEHLPFEKMADSLGDGLAVAEETIKKLLQKKILTEEEAKSVSPSDVVAFFDGEIGKRAALAAKEGRLYKETPFTYAMDMDGEEVFVQGIIDCFFIEDGKIVLLDYKTNYVSSEEDKERIRKTYKVQLQIYKKALEEAKGMNVKESYLYLNGLSEFI